jgi:hypothetical protein
LANRALILPFTTWSTYFDVCQIIYLISFHIFIFYYSTATPCDWLVIGFFSKLLLPNILVGTQIFQHCLFGAAEMTVYSKEPNQVFTDMGVSSKS